MLSEKKVVLTSQSEVFSLKTYLIADDKETLL